MCSSRVAGWPNRSGPRKDAAHGRQSGGDSQEDGETRGYACRRGGGDPVDQKKRDVKRVVLDTNVLVSALLFSGEMTRIVAGWKAGAFVPVFSRATFDEFRRVLAYPKFSLTVQEIEALIEDE